MKIKQPSTWTTTQSLSFVDIASKIRSALEMAIGIFLRCKISKHEILLERSLSPAKNLYKLNLTVYLNNERFTNWAAEFRNWGHWMRRHSESSVLYCEQIAFIDRKNKVTYKRSLIHHSSLFTLFKYGQISWQPVTQVWLLWLIVT